MGRPAPSPWPLESVQGPGQGTRYTGAVTFPELAMNVVVDARPSAELCDEEVVAYLFKEVRSREMRNTDQVKRACERMFPDMPEERRRACYGRLAQALEKGQP